MNLLKTRLKDGEKTAGAWAQLASPLAAEILGLAGFDWVLIDMEHSPADMMTLVSLMQALGGNATPVVRAPWNDFITIKRILDCGAWGVVIPYVNTREQAEKAVEACLYPPHGIRGIAGSPRAMGYGKNVKEYIQSADDEILVITQIETAEAVSNIDELVSVDGVDGFFIGPMDLATSMGHRGSPEEKDVQEAISLVEKKVFAANKILGTVAGSWEKARELYDRGYQMVTLLADGTALMRASLDAMGKFSDYKNRK